MPSWHDRPGVGLDRCGLGEFAQYRARDHLVGYSHIATWRLVRFLEFFRARDDGHNDCLMTLAYQQLQFTSGSLPHRSAHLY